MGSQANPSIFSRSPFRVTRSRCGCGSSWRESETPGGWLTVHALAGEVGSQLVRDVGDDAIDAGIDEARPVGLTIGGPGPDGHLTALRPEDQIGRDGVVLDGDSLTVALEERGEQPIDLIALH